MKKSSLPGSINKNVSTEPAPLSFSTHLKRYRWAVGWCLFHLCALLLSYNEVRFFNSAGEPKTEKFWPFVKFTYPYFLPNDNTTYVKFNGFFTQYDWTEFSFYVGVVLFLIVVAYVYKKSEQ